MTERTTGVARARRGTGNESKRQARAAHNGSNGHLPRHFLIVGHLLARERDRMLFSERERFDLLVIGGSPALRPGQAWTLHELSMRKALNDIGQSGCLNS